MRSAHVMRCVFHLTGHEVPIGMHMVGSLTVAVYRFIDEMSHLRLF